MEGVHKYKILIIGDSGVGKTSLVCKLVDDQFQETFISTIGVDFKIKDLLVDGNAVRLYIWDTAGQERFRSLTSYYYRNAHGIMICFDVCDLNSFENTGRWIEEMGKMTNGNVKARVLLVGTKCDLYSKRMVDGAIAREFADRNNMGFMETSATDSRSVAETFEELGRSILQNDILGAITPMKETRDAYLHPSDKGHANRPNYKKCCGGQS